jgi:site-specific recombinase XerD
MRHTVRSAMTSAGFDAAVQDRVTGHSVKGSAGTRVYTHVDVPLLRQAVEAIRYPGLTLCVAYKAENTSAAS